MIEPVAFLREAIRAVPAVKYALGVGGMLAATAIGYSFFKFDTRLAFVGAVVMLLLMTVLVVFARLSALPGTRLTAPAVALTWFALALFMVLSSTLFASVFFRKPLDLSCWLLDCRKTSASLPSPPTPVRSASSASAVPHESGGGSVVPSIQAASPPSEGRAMEDYGLALTTQYVRLSGALEVPILIQLQSAGGTTCYDELCSIGRDTGTTPSEYPVQTGHISRRLGDYWNNSWPFKSAMPLGLDTWKEIAGDGEVGIKLLERIDDSMSFCLDYKILRPEKATNGPLPPGLKCDRSDTQRVGFLFWVFKNESNRSLRDIELCYLKFTQKTVPATYVAKFKATTGKECATSTRLARIDAGKEVIVLLSVYERDSKGFEKAFLRIPIIPTSVRYSVEGKAYAYTPRAPLREKAATVPLPHGWYQQ
jgi:hypothetical protein